MNTRFKGIIIVFGVLAFMISSCRFSMPLVKWNKEKYDWKDTLGSSVVMKKMKHYDFFRISSYGVVGTCAKTRCYDTSAVLLSMKISRNSSAVCDGYVVNHTKIIFYDTNGKVFRKTFRTEKGSSWYAPQIKEKTIEYSSGKSKVTTKK